VKDLLTNKEFENGLSDIAHKGDVISATNDLVTTVELENSFAGVLTKFDLKTTIDPLLTKDTFTTSLDQAMMQKTSGLLTEEVFIRENDYNVKKMIRMLKEVESIFKLVSPLSKDEFWRDLKEEISLDTADQLAYVAKSDRVDKIFEDLSEMFGAVAITTDFTAIHKLVQSISSVVADISTTVTSTSATVLKSSAVLDRNTDYIDTLRQTVDNWNTQMLTDEFDKWTLFKEELTSEVSGRSERGLGAVNDMILNHEDKEEKRSEAFADDRDYTRACMRDIHRWSVDMLSILESLEKFIRGRAIILRTLR
jgi:hypothetical protein